MQTAGIKGTTLCSLQLLPHFCFFRRLIFAPREKKQIFMQMEMENAN